MEHKKGFTLVELLAVITLLAILVLLAMPNILNVLNEAKKKTFLNEVMTIYNESASKYIDEILQGNKVGIISSKDESKLSLEGEETDYCVLLNNKGEVEKIAVGNNSFHVILDDIKDKTDITVDDVKDGKLPDIECSTSGFAELSDAEENNQKIVFDCTSGQEFKSGATYDNGKYRYTYFNPTGWKVTVIDKMSTEALSAPTCSTVDGKPIVSAGGMFLNSQVTSLDLSTFDTSKVISMNFMFSDTKADKLDLSNFNTITAQQMALMFGNSAATSIIFGKNFNTSNVINMTGMFNGSQAVSLDLSNFNTSKVVDMSDMFKESVVTTLNLSTFDTSKVEYIESMFEGSKITEGYARTQADADKFNSSYNKPESLVFVVK